MSIAVNLRALRDRAGLTQRELAKASSVRQSLLSKYEKSYCDIGAANLFKLARALHCRVGEIDPRCADEEDSPEERARVRRVDDDILLYIVDNWTELSVDTRAEIAGLVAATASAAPKPPKPKNHRKNRVENRQIGPNSPCATVGTAFPCVFMKKYY